MSGCIHHLASLHSPVFLLNSCLDLFSAPHLSEDPLSRSYGVSLPSSLATNLSTPQYVLPDHVCPFTVRVPDRLSSAVFLGSMITCTIDFPRRERHTVMFQLGWWICLPSSRPTHFNALFRQRAAVSLLRHHGRPERESRNVNRAAIALAVRLRLRTRLTPG